MALGDFFRINMPYGMKRSQDGKKWAFFNREYSPLGYNESGFYNTINDDESPFYVEYKRLKEGTLQNLAWHPDAGLRRNEKGEIVQVFFYNDATNPAGKPNSSPLWTNYFYCIEKLSKLKSV
jgi:hypothetical protein